MAYAVNSVVFGPRAFVHGMSGEDVWTWPRVRAALESMGRGAPHRLAKALAMNSSYFYRKLKSKDDLTQRQVQVVRTFLEGEDQPIAATLAPADPQRREVPVFGYAAAGGGDLVALNDGDVVETMLLPYGLELGPGDWFVVRALGSSMEPRIFPGDPLLVRRRSPPIRDKDVLVEMKDGSGLVKLYKGERDGRVFLEQLNPPATLSIEGVKVRALHGAVIRL